MADEYYIPFDLGSWRSRGTQIYTCHKHGIQAGGLVIAVTPRLGAVTTKRQYCGLCVIDVLDSMIQPMVEVK